MPPDLLLSALSPISFTDKESRAVNPIVLRPTVRTVAITPSKSKSLPFEEVRRVCQDNALAGLEAIFEARGQSDSGRPFRFMYISGSAAERDQNKTPSYMPQYRLMRVSVRHRLHPEAIKSTRAHILVVC